jgi:hypothetical protein
MPVTALCVWEIKSMETLWGPTPTDPLPHPLLIPTIRRKDGRSRRYISLFTRLWMFTGSASDFIGVWSTGPGETRTVRKNRNPRFSKLQLPQVSSVDGTLRALAGVGCPIFSQLHGAPFFLESGES